MIRRRSRVAAGLEADFAEQAQPLHALGLSCARLPKRWTERGHPQLLISARLAIGGTDGGDHSTRVAVWLDWVRTRAPRSLRGSVPSGCWRATHNQAWPVEDAMADTSPARRN